MNRSPQRTAPARLLRRIHPGASPAL